MEKDLGKLKKNDTTGIIIRIDDFGGKTGLTIREYVTSERYTGFSKSGTRISAESFKEFKDIINSIDEKDFEQETTAEKKSEEHEEKSSEKQKKTKKKAKEETPKVEEPEQILEMSLDEVI